MYVYMLLCNKLNCHIVKVQYIVTCMPPAPTSEARYGSALEQFKQIPSLGVELHTGHSLEMQA